MNSPRSHGLVPLPQSHPHRGSSTAACAPEESDQAAPATAEVIGRVPLPAGLAAGRWCLAGVLPPPSHLLDSEYVGEDEAELRVE
eukprot:scaffold123_cov54-Phaeocystis_antarctica.AAC.3